MKVYFASYAGSSKVGSVEEGDSLLESFIYFQNKDYRKYHTDNKLLGKDLFLDSGAFTAFTKGKKIDLDEYIKFIFTYKDMLEVYAGLDVIGDWQKTKANVEYMESKGLSPLPTFHVGSPLTELRRMLSKYDYIALGGLVPISMNRGKMESWLDTCFSVIVQETVKKGKPLAKVHGFGLNSFWAWKKYPFYSVDATSWLMGGVFRRIVKFNQKEGKFEGTSKMKPEQSVAWVRANKSHYQELNTENLREYKKAAAFVTELWEKRGVKW